MRVTVIVPTYRRVSDLDRCLQGLRLQQREAEEVLVVVRDIDRESRDFLHARKADLPLRMVEVKQGGQVAALNAGLQAATGDIIMMTDDDTIPRPDWIERVERLFSADRKLGGVGGRDIVHEQGRILGGQCHTVGKIQWFGRIVGNHHLECPSVLSVDILKGANMSYRSAAIQRLRFDANLRGLGAQVGNDMAFSLSVKYSGWSLLYDPAVIVDHYPAPRIDDDQRSELGLAAIKDMSFNHWWTLKRRLPPGPKRSASLLWEQWIGTKGRPGLLRELITLAKADSYHKQIAAAARGGRKEASMALTGLQPDR